MGAIKLFMLDDWISFVSFGLQEDLDAVCVCVVCVIGCEIY